MQTIYFFSQWLDYWVERYQTLGAGLAAMAVAIWAVRPAIGQLKILQLQRADQIRERLAAKYKMIATAIALLDSDAWRAKAKFSERPTEEAFNHADMGEALKAAYAERKVLWSDVVAQITTALDPAPLSALSGTFDAVSARFGECDAGLANPASDTLIELWFWCAQNPDLMVTYQMAAARGILAGFAADVVADMASPAG